VGIPPPLRDFQAEWESPAFGLFHAASFSTALLPIDSATEPLKPAYIAALVVTSAIFVPFAYFPMPTVDQYIAYSKFMHLAPPKIENHKQGPLPQLYTDQFGRKEMAQVVAEASLSLDSLLLYAG